MLLALPGAPDPTSQPCIALSTVNPAVSRNAADCPPFASFLCTFPLATLNMRDRRLTFLNHPPLHPVFYTSSRSSSCQCCGAWCCNLVSRTFFRPHYHHYPTSGPSSPSSFEPSAPCKRGRTVHGSLPLPEPSVPDFLFDCCSCQHPRPCEHVRGARMRSNPVPTQVEPMKSAIH